MGACSAARALAELSFRDLVPAIWLPNPQLRGERERCRFRLHLVKHRSSLRNRIHSTLIAFGHQCPVSDLFGVTGRKLLKTLDIPEPWRGHVEASLELIDDLDRRISEMEKELKRSGADHRYVPLLMTAPGIGWVTGFTIATEIGDIGRFSSPTQYLRWGLVEAAMHAADHPLYRERYQRTKRRLGKQRGPKVAQIELARKLAEAIWYMLTRDKPFAPADAKFVLAA